QGGENCPPAAASLVQLKPAFGDIRMRRFAMMIDALERRVLLAVALDPTFGINGTVGGALGQVPDQLLPRISLIEQLPDQKLIVVGSISRIHDVPIIRVARYNAGGVLDTTFGGGDGFAEVTVPNSGVAAGGAIQSDGKIVVATSAGNEMAVVRFNADGSLDTTYGGGDGIATAPATSTDLNAFDVAVAEDDKV